MSPLSKVVIALVLITVAGFCIFGYLATYESPGYLTLRVIYAIAGFICFASAIWLLRTGKTKTVAKPERPGI